MNPQPSQPAAPSTLPVVRRIATVVIPASDLPLYESMQAIYKLDDTAFASDAVNLVMFLFRNGFIGGRTDLLQEGVALFADLRSVKDRVLQQVARGEKQTLEAAALLGTLKQQIEQIEVLNQRRQDGLASVAKQP